MPLFGIKCRDVSEYGKGGLMFSIERENGLKTSRESRNRGPRVYNYRDVEKGFFNGIMVLATRKRVFLNIFLKGEERGMTGKYRNSIRLERDTRFMLMTGQGL